MRNDRTIRQAARAAFPLTILGIAAALTMSGCAPALTAAPASNAPAAAGQDLTGLQGGNAGTSASNLLSVVNAPRMDGGSVFTGQIVHDGSPDPTVSVQVYDAPGGAPLAWLDHSQSLPVIAHATGNAPKGVSATTGGWTRIMLPSRRSLPSQTPAGLLPYINQGTGWVWDADVAVAGAANTRVIVNKTAGTVTVGSVDNTSHKSFPAVIGTNVPVGPTFIASPAYPPAPCGDLSLTLMAAQGTNADSLPRQTVNPTAIAGPSEHCLAEGGMDLTDALPNMVRLSPADARELESRIVPGTPVDVISADAAPDGTTNTTVIRNQIAAAVDSAFAKAGQR
ncbi:hypothetical protein [Arthrobacter sp. 2MCAF14]|uniref:hypothetical protein n=1 Tax=Arthrobacter sp. 2MCAF14 TaxID=3232982 RepID=UPI003F939701